jgi:hypothetical protein
MLSIEVVHLNIARALLERAVRDLRVRDTNDLARVVDLLYGAEPDETDLLVVNRVAGWVERNPLQASASGIQSGDSAVLEFLRAMTRYLPDRIAISTRGERPWFAFELPQRIISTGPIPRVPPPHQWFIHTELVNSILKTFSGTPTLEQVRNDARRWMRSEAYHIKAAAAPT